MKTIELDMYQATAVAALVLLLGRVLVAKISILRRYCIPAPVVGGFLYAIVHTIVRGMGILEISCDMTLKNVFMVAFFCSVGFTASFRMLKKGGVQTVVFLALSAVMVILQNILGAGLASVFGLDPRLGLATGSTPIGTYKNLVAGYENGDYDFSNVRSVNLDEYKGLPKENEQSYYYFMHDNLFSHVNIDPANTHLPDGTEPDSQKACEEYNKVIASMGGVDLQLLGLGHDGHIGFNEPNDVFDKETHCVDLTEMTIEANKRFFNSIDEVPRQAYTMGIATIMRAKCVLMVVSGKDKAEILKKSFFGPITPQVPASILQLHPNFVLIADEDALSAL